VGGDEDVSVEVGEEVLGVTFAAVEADDAEVLGTDLLYAGVQDTTRLGDGVLTAS
jgi:hypothetical protein